MNTKNLDLFEGESLNKDAASITEAKLFANLQNEHENKKRRLKLIGEIREYFTYVTRSVLVKGEDKMYFCVRGTLHKDIAAAKKASIAYIIKEVMSKQPVDCNVLSALVSEFQDNPSIKCTEKEYIQYLVANNIITFDIKPDRLRYIFNCLYAICNPYLYYTTIFRIGDESKSVSSTTKNEYINLKGVVASIQDYNIRKLDVDIYYAEKTLRSMVYSGKMTIGYYIGGIKKFHKEFTFNMLMRIVIKNYWMHISSIPVGSKLADHKAFEAIEFELIKENWGDPEAIETQKHKESKRPEYLLFIEEYYKRLYPNNAPIGEYRRKKRAKAESSNISKIASKYSHAIDDAVASVEVIPKAKVLESDTTLWFLFSAQGDEHRQKIIVLEAYNIDDAKQIAKSRCEERLFDYSTLKCVELIKKGPILAEIDAKY